MVLSLPALRGGFDKYVDGNTAVHEFVHLIDKADGVVDGVPEYLIPKELIKPWMKEMNRTIREIREGDSEIRTYAGTNEAEFLAVLSEYFFKKPKKLQDEHPELFALLDKIYNRKSDI
jgi:Mlc titration factor MtfA (ptsG expression regulator)